jgi:hypothetical protein
MGPLIFTCSTWPPSVMVVDMVVMVPVNCMLTMPPACSGKWHPPQNGHEPLFFRPKSAPKKAAMPPPIPAKTPRPETERNQLP